MAKQYKEFSAYGRYANIVEQLVEVDKGAKQFFEYHTSRDLPVKYIPYLDLPRGREAIKNALAIHNPLIIATTIELQNMDKNNYPIRGRKSTHSILLLWHRSIIYLYDPNGNYNITNQNLVYKIHHHLGQSISFPPNTEDAGDQLAQFLNLPDGMKFKVPLNPGIQVTNPTQDDSPYIGEGGYCMFYNWLAIEFIKKAVDAVPAQGLSEAMHKAYNQVCNPAPMPSPFPFPPAATSFNKRERAKDDTLESHTVQIINKVVASATAATAAAAATATGVTLMDTSIGGGAKRRRKHRSKRRSSRRRKRRHQRPKKRKRKKFTRKRKKLRQKKQKKKRRTYKIF